MASPATLRYAAFTDDPRGGNPAGVVLASELPPETEMQRIAAEVGFSETAFVAPSSGGADHDIRYFSPEREVVFCGHATIATGVVLAERDPELGEVLLATRTDLIPVAIRRDGHRIVATLTSPPTSHREAGDDLLAEVLGMFGWTRDDLDPRLPPAIAYGGATHLVLPVASRGTLAAMTYRFDDLKRVMLEQDWTTVAVVWRESDDRFHARNPFPIGGVVEDPATGASAAAFGGYLRDAGLLAVPARLTILQGEDMGRPSLIQVDVPADRPGIGVGGSAVAMP
ncbi:MAG: PhzF family phenazine biosynthesis protein [Actinobacteria bacterium]|nr:PhzF family phenazine biosynthesis protein [Actinomycetota bacterium]